MAKTQRGGKREGAGRPKGSINPSTITKEQAREALRQIVLQHMSEMASAQIAQAKGLKYLVTRDKASGKFLRVTEAMAAARSGESDQIKALVELRAEIGADLNDAEADALNAAIDALRERVPPAPDSREIVEVWEKDPSVQAFTDLMNRALDKPKEQEQEIKLTGEADLIAALYAGRTRAASRNKS